LRLKHFAAEDNPKRKHNIMKTTELELDQKVVSPKEWEVARQQLLVKEKELTRARDKLAAERRCMPWVAVEKEYEFEGPQGKLSLFDLFDGRRQLIVYRAFFEPGVVGWPEHACVGCSMVADQVAHPAHLNARDTTLVFASRAPQKDIKRLKARMGSAMATACFAPTSSTIAATNRWGLHGTISTSLRLDVRRNGRIRPRLILRPHRMSGGIGTTSTVTTKPPPGFSNRFSVDAQPGKRTAASRDRSPRRRADGRNKNDNAGLPTQLSKHYE